MKKFGPKYTWIYILGASAAILLVLFAMLAVIPKKPEQQTQSPIYTAIEKKDVNELYLTACTSAEKGGTCKTKLVDLGLIMPEDCCKKFSKCC